MKVFVSTSSFGKYGVRPLEILAENGFEVMVNPLGRRLEEKEIRAHLKGIDGLIAGTEPLTRAVLAEAQGLKVISRCGTGLDNVDRAAAEELDIRVLRTPESPALAVAELTIGLMLDGLRHISRMDRSLRDGRWEKSMGSLLSGKTVGVVGAGYVGRKVIELLRPFGCAVLVNDIDVNNKDMEAGFTPATLGVLLRESEIVTLHLPLTDATFGLFGEEKFLQMKDGALLINTSRGEIIDEQALAIALRNGKVGHACLDVFMKEPYEGELRAFDNVTLTSHAGSYAREVRLKMEVEAAENLVSAFKTLERAC